MQHEDSTARFLRSRLALVTGATSGIGLAIATAFSAAGARVALSGLGGADEIAAAVNSVMAAGGEGRHFAADLSRPEETASLVCAVERWAPIDILVNCAGIQHTAPLAELEPDHWERILAVNLSAAFYTSRLVLPGMAARGFGRVINIASVHGLVASRYKAPYVASKFGLVGLSKVAALEYAAAGDRQSGGVTVNCICPGWVETPLIEPQIAARAARFGGDRQAGLADLVGEKQPTRRTSLPAEIADLALWLCRPAAHNITGAALPIDGGWTAV